MAIKGNIIALMGCSVCKGREFKVIIDTTDLDAPQVGVTQLATKGPIQGLKCTDCDQMYVYTKDGLWFYDESQQETKKAPPSLPEGI